MKKNGFTLIELLAVIVILAVIALIATPVIMNAINDAKKGAAKDAAYGVVKAVEYSVALAANEGSSLPGSSESLTGLPTGVSVKGTAPASVSLTLTNGAVSGGYVVVNGFKVTFNAAGVATVQ